MVDGRNKAITVIDDLFSSEDCQAMIEYLMERSSEWQLHHPMLRFIPIVPKGTHEPIDLFAKSMVMKVFRCLDSTVRVQRAHIEMRAPGESLPWHFDEAVKSAVFTSVTYLNDDYEGGQTSIRPIGETTDRYDTIIRPRVGRTVFFDGTLHYHGVSQIEGPENRFTLPIWYMAMPSDFPDKKKWWITESFSPGTG